MRARLVIAVLLLAAPLAAQEFDIFDPNDFIDPRLRGAEFNARGFGVVKPGDDFTVFRAYGGRISDYQWRNTPTNIDVSFLHLARSRYYGNKQLNLKLTAFDPDGGEESLPRYRGTIQYARYFVTQKAHPGQEEKGDDRVSARILLNYTIEHADAREDARHRAHEYGVEIDGYVRYRKFAPTGSLIWTRRWAGKETGTSDRYTYYYRAPVLTWGRLQIASGVGVGVERTTNWHVGAVRAVVNGSFELPWGFTVNASIAPAYLPSLERNTYREAAVYLDRTIRTHLKRRE